MKGRNNSKKLFAPGVHEAIKKHQDSLYRKEEISYETYLTLCFSLLNHKLKSVLKKDYIFGKLYYRRDINKPPEIFDFFENDPSGNISQIFSEGIVKLESLVNAGISKSLSVVIIERFLRGMLMYKGKNPQQIPSFINSNLEDSNASKFIHELSKIKKVVYSKFDENDKKGLETLYHGHRDLAKNSELENIYSYLIRTRTYGDDFNGVLYLVLGRSLNTSEYSDIADLLTFILEIGIKYGKKPDVQQKEWQRIFDYQTHSNQQELSAIILSIERLRDANSSKNQIEFDRHYQKIKNYVDTLGKRNTLILNLSRHKSDDVDNQFLKKQWQQCNIILYLEHILETIFDSIATLSENEDKLENIKKDCLPKLRESILALPNIYSTLVPAGLELILLERLKNTIFYTDDNDPKASVSIEELDDHYHLIFTNNMTIDNGSYFQIKNGTFPEVSKGPYRTKIGERFIRAIIDNRAFCMEGGWQIDIDPASIDEQKRETKIFYVIPKQRQK